MKKTVMIIRSVNITIIATCILAALVLSSGCESGNAGTVSYADAKTALLREETLNPASFLTSDGTYRKSFLGDEFVLEGSVFSNANQVEYKDVVIQINFYSETETLINSERYVLYKVVSPKQSISFEWRIERPNSAEKLGWEVVDAVSL